MEYRRIDINGNALVVAFDMCSSTRLIEELTLRGDLSRYDRLVRVIKEYLAVAQKQVAFDPYKFNGDGWILLFPSTASGEAVFDCLQGLCEHYRSAIKKLVLPHLAVRPRINGLTFGIECGPLRRLTIFGQREYVGRPINVACRLQAAIKDNDGSPAYKALVSNAAYREYLGFSNKRVQVWKVNRKLRNIRGGSDVPWKKIEFLNRRAT